MGTFSGHAVAGGFFLAFGIWWTCQLAYILVCQHQRRRRISSKSPVMGANKTKAWNTSPAKFLMSTIDHRRDAPPSTEHRITHSLYTLRNYLHKVPLESFAMLIGGICGIIVELPPALPHDQYSLNVAYLQHTVMYLSYFLLAVANILVHFGIVHCLPIDYMSMLAALMWEALLFNFHIEHLTGLPHYLHTFLIWTALAAGFATFLEMLAACLPRSSTDHVPEGDDNERVRGSELLLMTFRCLRIYFILVQGSWLYQIGFLLYNPFVADEMSQQWVPEHIENMGFWCSMFYIWHCMAVALFMLTLSAIVYCIERCCRALTTGSGSYCLIQEVIDTYDKPRLLG